ncbi:tryptophan 7-halogenase [Tsukamurella sp. 8F]|uniref:tryptophan 7-halogenase n=1 Tax=unclassified Tsukamurella TaxID=2633480 RepID=UPI0023B962C5|nr:MULTISPECIES: tryptophan 7-halogenase [unclassified Tsukamurella]MDF0531687.1 tryptophan 7-halogenase [Tsukamurella sp. 8J]MDF0588933.1 tryptophan 7-halogenase [Tsukamurella sp. 8F]
MTKAISERLTELSDDQRAALTEALRARRSDESDRPGHDVVVLGGGTAGLTLALQLLGDMPDLRVAIVERREHPVPETTHKVGESTVEIAAHYLRETMGLREHLETRQIRKFGLRMFFSTDDNTDIGRRVELGSSQFPPLNTYQLDRGRLENELAQRCARAGVDLLSGHMVTGVDLSSADCYHQVRLSGPDGERELSARWIVDASGRNKLLQRHNHAQKKVPHSANAAWFRIAHPIDVNTWSSGTNWSNRITDGDRAMSTNHLMGPGYWVWLIRLASGSTSVGIVAESDAHPFRDFNRLDKALEWLRVKEPQCAALIDEHRDAIQDFHVMRDYAYSCDKVFSGDERWCLTGESALFLDPLYSPGLDLIAIGNGLVVDLISRSQRGEDVTALAAIHDRLFRSVTEIWLAIYQGQYRLMGNARVMSSKVIWDTAFYWGVFGLLFFQDKFRVAATTPAIAANLERLTQISNRMQQFFREWESIDDTQLTDRFVDLYAPLDFMVKLHTGMADALTDVEFEARFADNTRLFGQLAGQLMSTVIETYAERTLADDVVARIQEWQRDSLVADLIATYRRERKQNPTSTKWMMVGQPEPPAMTDDQCSVENAVTATA